MGNAKSQNEKTQKIPKEKKKKKVNEMHKNAKEFIVTIPEGIKGGETFLVKANNTLLNIKSPSNAKPNQKLKFYIPEETNENITNNKNNSNLIRTKNKCDIKKYDLEYKHYYITIPEGIKPGDNLTIDAEGKKITIVCPKYNYPNERVRIKIPLNTLDNYNNSNNYNNYNNYKNVIKLEYYNDVWYRYLKNNYFYWDYYKLSNESINTINVIKTLNSNAEYNILDNSFVCFSFNKSDFNNKNNFNVELCEYCKYYLKNNFAEKIISLSLKTYNTRIDWIKNEFDKIKIPWEEGHIKIKVRRSNLLEDSIKAFNDININDLKKTFRYEFIGEPALDSNGVAKEFYELISKEIVKPEFQLFEIIDSIQDSYQLNYNSFINDNHINYFYSYGRILGKSLFDGYTTPINLSPLIYKHILQYPVNFNDLKIIEPDVYKSFIKLVEMENIEELELLELNFTLDEKIFDTIENIELVPNGKNILLDQTNIFDYINAQTKYRVFYRTHKQLEALLKGFYEIVPLNIITLLDYDELKLWMHGTKTYDIDDWKKNTLYKGEFENVNSNNITESTNCVKWFWELVENYDNKKKEQLVQFITGSTSIPTEGFSKLKSTDGKICKFTINGDSQIKTFPRTHTCFNRIDLPIYKTKEEMIKYFDIALDVESVGFGTE